MCNELSDADLFVIIALICLIGFCYTATLIYKFALKFLLDP